MITGKEVLGRCANSAPTARRETVRWSSGVIAPLLVKLAKHMALLSCLVIVAGATGRIEANALGIFFLVVSAAVLHSVGRRLEHRRLVSVGYDRGAP
ncbi:MAG: hypothetical protein ACM3SP_00025 [Chloroflexota bacterium]